MNNIRIPENPHNIIDSVISTKPIVNHHIKKNGFSALRRIPAKNEFLLGFDLSPKSFRKIDFICRPAKTNSPIAPITVIRILYSGNASNDIVPKPKKTINGNSTTV